MRTRTDTLVFRLGFTLAVLVLAAFLALVGAIVLRRRDASSAARIGWAAGIVLAFAWPRPCAARAARSWAAWSTTRPEPTTVRRTAPVACIRTARRGSIRASPSSRVRAAVPVLQGGHRMGLTSNPNRMVAA